MKTLIALSFVMFELCIWCNDLEISKIDLDRNYEKLAIKIGNEQAISIANRSNKAIDLYDYSITINDIEVFRFKEHLYLSEKTSKKIPLRNIEEKNTGNPAINFWLISQTEKEANNNKRFQLTAEKYHQYMKEEDFNEMMECFSSKRTPFLFSEIALLSPKREKIDQVLVSDFCVQKNPYSSVAYLDPDKYLFTSVFKKDNKIVVSTISEMIPFQATRIRYCKEDNLLSVFESPSEYFGLGSMCVPDQKMTLRLYYDEKHVEEIVCLEGDRFYFYIVNKEQGNKIEDFFMGEEKKKVYYEIVVSHPDFPELSLSSPILGHTFFYLDDSAKDYGDYLSF